MTDSASSTNLTEDQKKAFIKDILSGHQPPSPATEALIEKIKAANKTTTTTPTSPSVTTIPVPSDVSMPPPSMFTKPPVTTPSAPPTPTYTPPGPILPGMPVKEGRIVGAKPATPPPVFKPPTTPLVELVTKAKKVEVEKKFDKGLALISSVRDVITKRFGETSPIVKRLDALESSLVHQKLVASTKNTSIDTSSVSYQTALKTATDKYTPTWTEIKQDLIDAGYTRKNFGLYNRVGIIFTLGDAIKKTIGAGSRGYDEFLDAVVKFQQSSAQKAIVSAVDTDYKVIKHGDIKYLGGSDELTYIIQNASPTSSRKLEQAFRAEMANPTKDQTNLKKAFETAYNTLSNNAKANYNIKYLDWSTIEPDKIKYYPGGQSYIRTHLDEVLKGFEQAYQKNPSAFPEVNDVMVKLYGATAGTWGKYGTPKGYPYDIVKNPVKGPTGSIIRRDAMRDILTMKPDERITKYYEQLPAYARYFTVPVGQAFVGGFSSMLLLPELFLEEVVGRMQTGIPVQVITPESKIGGLPVGKYLSREGYGQIAAKHYGGGPGGVGSGLPVQIITGLTQQREKAPTFKDWMISQPLPAKIYYTTNPAAARLAYSMQYGKKSEEWKRIEKYPIAAISATGGELAGWFYGGKVLGAAYTGTKLTTTRGLITPATKHIIKPFVRYTPRLYQGLSGLKFAQYTTKIKLLIRKISESQTKIDTISKTIKHESGRIKKLTQALNAKVISKAKYNKIANPIKKSISKLIKQRVTLKLKLSSFKSQKTMFIKKLKPFERQLAGKPYMPPKLISAFSKSKVWEGTTKWIKGGTEWGTTPTKAAYVEAYMRKYGIGRLASRGWQRATGKHRVPLKPKEGISKYHLIEEGKLVDMPKVKTHAEMLKHIKESKHPITGEYISGAARMGPQQSFMRIPMTGKFPKSYFKPPKEFPLARGPGVTIESLIVKPVDKVAVDVIHKFNLSVGGAKGLLMQAKTSALKLSRKTVDWDVICRKGITTTKKIADDVANYFTEKTGIKYVVHQGREPGIYTIYEKGTRVYKTQVMDIVSGEARKGKIFASKNLFINIKGTSVVDLDTLTSNMIDMWLIGRKDTVKLLKDLRIATGLTKRQIFDYMGGPYAKIVRRLIKPRSIQTLIKTNIDKSIVRAIKRNRLILGGSGGAKLQAKISIAYLKRKVGDWDVFFDGTYAQTRGAANRAADDIANFLRTPGAGSVKKLGHEGSYRVYYKGKGIMDITSTQSPRMGAAFAYKPWINKIPVINIGGYRVADLQYLLERKILMARAGALKSTRSSFLGFTKTRSKTVGDIGMYTGLKGKQLYEFYPRQYGGTMIEAPRSGYGSTWIGRSWRTTPEGIEIPGEWGTPIHRVHLWPYKSPEQIRRSLIGITRRQKPWLQETAYLKHITPPKRTWTSESYYDWIGRQGPTKASYPSSRQMVMGFAGEEEHFLPSGLFKHQQPLGFDQHLRTALKPVPSTLTGKMSHYAKVAYEKYGDWWAKITGYRSYEILPDGRVNVIRSYRLLTPDEALGIKSAVSKAKLGNAKDLGKIRGIKTTSDGKQFITATGEHIDAKVVAKVMQPGKQLTTAEAVKLAKKSSDLAANITTIPYIRPTSVVRAITISTLAKRPRIKISSNLIAKPHFKFIIPSPKPFTKKPSKPKISKPPSKPKIIKHLATISSKSKSKSKSKASFRISSRPKSKSKSKLYFHYYSLPSEMSYPPSPEYSYSPPYRPREASYRPREYEYYPPYRPTTPPPYYPPFIIPPSIRKKKAYEKEEKKKKRLGYKQREFKFVPFKPKPFKPKVFKPKVFKPRRRKIK